MRCPRCGTEVSCDHPDTFLQKALVWAKVMKELLGQEKKPKKVKI